MDEQVLARFVRDGRLVVVAIKRSKLRVVLDHLAQAFEPGRTYAESDVVAVLGGYHPDHAMLRGALVTRGSWPARAGSTGAPVGPSRSEPDR